MEIKFLNALSLDYFGNRNGLKKCICNEVMYWNKIEVFCVNFFYARDGTYNTIQKEHPI